MNNFSEKDLVSIQDLVSSSSLNKNSGHQEQKTQTSLALSYQTKESSTPTFSLNELQYNENDQITTFTSQKNYQKVQKIQNSTQTQDILNLKNISDYQIYFEGSIYRSQGGILSSWEKRFIVLTKAKLFFFQNQFKNHLLGCVFIKHLPVSLQKKNENLEISCNDQGQRIILKGISEIQTSLWHLKINDVIKHCQNQKKVVIKKFNRSIYQQKDFILEQQFLQKAQSGDLLLVSSDNSASYLQKFLMHSQFNHVAMILKYKDQIKIFQANQDDGVSIYDWKQYLQVFKDHKRFAFRRLNYSRKQEFQQKLKEMAKQFRGRGYSISSTRMLRRTSNDLEDNDVDRQFFCSQIVAKIYKNISILDKDISSVRYWPINFTSRGQLNLMDGAYLSSQKNILLSKHLKI